MVPRLEGRDEWRKARCSSSVGSRWLWHPKTYAFSARKTPDKTDSEHLIFSQFFWGRSLLRWRGKQRVQKLHATSCSAGSCGCWCASCCACRCADLSQPRRTRLQGHAASSRASLKRLRMLTNCCSFSMNASTTAGSKCFPASGTIIDLAT
jgi:hypothetical protein